MPKKVGIFNSKSGQQSEADDLKIINGIGPAVEKRLHGDGIFTFAQLAVLSSADIAAAVADLSGLSAERITKQDWTGQARKLVPESIPNEVQKEATL
jgi:large subunit ribosomal protein L21